MSYLQKINKLGFLKRYMQQSEKTKPKEEKIQEDEEDLEEEIEEISKEKKKPEMPEVTQFKSRRRIETGKENFNEDLSSLANLLKESEDDDSLENILGSEILKNKHNLKVKYDSKSSGSQISDARELYSADSSEKSFYDSREDRIHLEGNSRGENLYQGNIEINPDPVAWNKRVHWGTSDNPHIKGLDNKEINPNEERILGQTTFGPVEQDGFARMSPKKDSSIYESK